MFKNLLDSNNNITFNVILVQVLGLEGAVYCSQVLDIYGKAERNNKFINKDFVELNREYIKNRTTISEDRQIDLDFMLANLQIISRDEENYDLIKIYPEVVASLIVGKSDVEKDIKYPAFNIVATPKDKKEKLRLGLSSSDEEILEALNLWFDAVLEDYDSRKKLTGPSVHLFQKGILEYSNGDRELILELIRLATVNKDVDAKHPMNRYTQGIKQEAKINHNTKIYKKKKSQKQPQKQHENYTENIATVGSLSKKIF